jgi:hypothetical protein
MILAVSFLIKVTFYNFNVNDEVVFGEFQARAFVSTKNNFVQQLIVRIVF